MVCINKLNEKQQSKTKGVKQFPARLDDLKSIWDLVLAQKLICQRSHEIVAPSDANNQCDLLGNLMHENNFFIRV